MLMKSEVLWAVDTHILVYATAPDAPLAKQQTAHALLSHFFTSPMACLPGQVLSEYLAVVLRKKTMPPRLAMESASTWAKAARILSASESAYEQAWKLATAHHYQVWDALI